MTIGGTDNAWAYNARPVGRDERGWPTIDRLTEALARTTGMPIDRARVMVLAVFDAIRADLVDAQRFVIPGVLVVDRRPEGSKKGHRVQFVYLRRIRQAEKRAAQRAKRRAGL